MLTFFKRYKFIAFLLILVIAGVVAYQQFFLNTDRDFLRLSQDSSVIDGSVVGREIIKQLNELQSLNLGGSLITDPAYRSLIDFEREIVPEPTGRDNPFAPIGR